MAKKSPEVTVTVKEKKKTGRSERLEIVKKETDWKDTANRWAYACTVLGAAIMALGSIIICVAYFFPDPKPGRRKAIPKDESDEEDERPSVVRTGTHD